MSPKRLGKAALLGLVAGAVAAAGACSLILPAGDLDSQYKADAGGGGPGTSTSTSAGTSASTSSASTSSASTSSASTSSGAGGGAGDGGVDCCADGGCSKGQCPVAQLVSGGASALGCGGGAAYWYDGANVQRAPADGGAVCTCALGIEKTYIIGVAEGYVVLSTYGSSRHIFAWPAPCCGQEPPYVPIVEAAPWNQGFALELGAGVTSDGTNAYWLDDYDVMRVPLEGGAAEAFYPWPDGSAPGLSGLAVTATDVLFNAFGEGSVYDRSTVGQPDYSTSTPDNGGGVRSNGTYAVWATDYQGLHLWRIRTGLEWPLGSFNPTGVAIDDLYVYAADGPNGLILRWTIAEPDAGPTTLETLPDGSAPSRLCVDGPYLYWLDGSGAIYQAYKGLPPDAQLPSAFARLI